MNRDTFIFQTKWVKALSGLDDLVRLEIYEAIIGYASSGILPNLRSQASIAFNFIKIDIDKSNENYEIRCEQNRINGRKGGRPKTHSVNSVSRKTERLISKPKKPYNDYDSDNDIKENTISSFGDSIKESSRAAPLPKRKEDFINSVLLFSDQYDSEMLQKFIQYWTEETHDKSRMKFELQKTWNTQYRLRMWKKLEKQFNERNNYGKNNGTYQTAAERSRSDIANTVTNVLAKYDGE